MSLALSKWVGNWGDFPYSYSFILRLQPGLRQKSRNDNKKLRYRRGTARRAVSWNLV